MNDQETYNSVKWALEAGYKHIDTAEWYENERETGRALNDYLSEYWFATRVALSVAGSDMLVT